MLVDRHASASSRPALLGLDGVDPFGREATVWSAFGAGYLFVPLVAAGARAALAPPHRASRRARGGLMERLRRPRRRSPPASGRRAVTIGKFDGVHLGHRAVLAQFCELAADARLRIRPWSPSTGNPLALLRPERCPASLVSHGRSSSCSLRPASTRRSMLAFDRAFASCRREEFVDRVLVDACTRRVVLVGRDFRFGRGAAATVELLRGVGAEPASTS